MYFDLQQNVILFAFNKIYYAISYLRSLEK